MTEVATGRDLPLKWEVLVACISKNGIDPRLSEAPQTRKNWPLWLSYAQRQ